MHKHGVSIEIGGARLHTQTTGNATGRGLLFLHGGGGTLDDFDPIIGAFANYHCVLTDSRGHGASTLGDGVLTYPRLAEDVEAVIAAHGMQNPVLIGHSDGGIAAIHVAARGRAALGGMVLLNAYAYPPPPKVMEEIFAQISAESWRRRFPESVALYEQINSEPDFDRFFLALSTMWRDASAFNYPGELAKDVMCPTLVIGADADHLVPREETIALARLLPDVRLGIIPFGSHISFQTHPHLVVPHILEFLRELG